jgi:hypothetical protein
MPPSPLRGSQEALQVLPCREIVVGGHHIPLHHYWHTDHCDQRAGRWQVVWSQATEIR